MSTPNRESEVSAGLLLCVLLGAALLVMFATPSYFGLGVGDLHLQFGSWDSHQLTTTEPWQAGDLGQLRHLRFTGGATCTQVESGPLVMAFCR